MKGLSEPDLFQVPERVLRAGVQRARHYIWMIVAYYQINSVVKGGYSTANVTFFLQFYCLFMLRIADDMCYLMILEISHFAEITPKVAGHKGQGRG